MRKKEPCLKKKDKYKIKHTYSNDSNISLSDIIYSKEFIEKIYKLVNKYG